MCILRIGWVVVICLLQMCGTLKHVVGCSILRFWKPFSLKSWWQSSFCFLWAELTLEVRCYVGLDSRSTCKWDAEYSGFLFFIYFGLCSYSYSIKAGGLCSWLLLGNFLSCLVLKLYDILGTKSQASPTSSSFFLFYLFIHYLLLMKLTWYCFIMLCLRWFDYHILSLFMLMLLNLNKSTWPK